MDTKLVVAYITVSISILGWIALHFLARWREDRTRRIESMLAQLDRQIAEFYAPILNLIQQLWNARIVSDSLVRSDNNLSADELRAIRFHFWDCFFRPIHEKIIHTIETKLHLMIGGTEIPKSFDTYLRHATHQIAQFNLWEKEGLDVEVMEMPEWPTEFEEEIRAGLKHLQENRRLLLRGHEMTEDEDIHRGRVVSNEDREMVIEEDRRKSRRETRRLASSQPYIATSGTEPIDDGGSSSGHDSYGIPLIAPSDD